MRRVTRARAAAASQQRFLPDLPEETIGIILEKLGKLSSEDLLLSGMAVSQEWRNAALRSIWELDFHDDGILILAARLPWRQPYVLSLSGSASARHDAPIFGTTAHHACPLPCVCC